MHLVVETPNGNLVAGREQFEERMEKRRAEEVDGTEWKVIRRGWCLGSAEFKAKLAMAARLRRETTLPLPWIAARLHMGTWKSLNAKLYRWRKANERR